MSFTIQEFKENSRNKPIAIIEGLPKGTKNKYVYYENYKPKLEDLSGDNIGQSLIKDLDEKQLEDIKQSLKTESEPDDDKLINLYYKILQHLKEKKQRLVIKVGKLQPLPNPKKVERVYVAGISGSGKSHFSSNYIKQYLKMHKKDKNEFFLTSQIEHDDSLDKLDPNRISPEELIQDGIELDDLKNSIWLFDDLYSIENKNERNQVISIIDNLAETSRHDNISLVVTSHLISNGIQSRRILNEATKLVFFPKSNKKNIIYFLEKYERFPKDLITRCINLNSRWFMLDKSTQETVVLYEKGCFVI
jgi:hypothetical protein